MVNFADFFPEQQQRRGYLESYRILLSTAGRTMVNELLDYPDPLQAALSTFSQTDKKNFLGLLNRLLGQLQSSQVISMQRMCFSCRFLSRSGDILHCNLLNIRMETHQLRADCPEHEAAV